MTFTWRKLQDSGEQFRHGILLNAKLAGKTTFTLHTVLPSNIKHSMVLYKTKHIDELLEYRMGWNAVWLLDFSFLGLCLSFSSQCFEKEDMFLSSVEVIPPY